MDQLRYYYGRDWTRITQSGINDYATAIKL